MKLPFLSSFIVLIILVSYEIKKHSRIEADASKSFWDKEVAANRTRRKSLEHLDYITIPFDRLPMDLLTDQEPIAECHRILHTLAQLKIVNFTGITNTDLKLEYGAANLPHLMEYDQNYTLLARTLQKWADILLQEQQLQAATSVLEFAVSTKTDVRKTYISLAELYRTLGKPERIAGLLNIAQELRSLNKTSIVRTLQEFDQYNG